MDTNQNPRAVNHFVKPITNLIKEANTTELVMNGPNNMYLEQNGQWHRITNEKITRLFTPEYINAFFSAVNGFNNANLSDQTPFLSGHLPDGERIQIIIPPAAPAPAFAIRKHSTKQFTLQDYLEAGMFDDVTEDSPFPDQKTPQKAEKKSPKDILQFFKAIIKSKQNIIISGGTGTGKTTFLNTLSTLISDQERLVTIEDTREIQLIQPNKLHLTTQREDTSYGFNELLESSLRLRPDRIIAAELRGAEAFTYLRSVNTGHPGSITTLHANTCQGAISQLILLLSQAKTNLDLPSLKHMINTNVDVIIQINRFQNKRRITGILNRGHYIVTSR